MLLTRARILKWVLPTGVVSLFAFLGFFYFAHSVWYWVGLDIGGLEPDPIWNRLSIPAIYSISLAHSDIVAELFWPMFGGVLGLGIYRLAAYLRRLRQRA